MKKVMTIPVLAVLMGIFALPAQATEVEIEWKEPQKYRDIRSGDEGRKRFQERVFSELGEHIAATAARELPENQVLALQVTDLDLAGHVEFFYSPYSREIRIVRDLHFPSMAFSYELRDENGNVLASGEERIKDMSFRVFDNGRFRNEPFHYEKRLIDQWFEDAFVDTRIQG